MQSVADRWYVLYSRISLAMACLFVIAAALSLAIPRLHQLTTTLGVNYTVLGLAAIHLIYTLIFYRSAARKYGIAPATTITALINCLGILSLMQSTGTLSSWYSILWGILVLAIGMFGTYALVASVFMMATYFVIVTSTTPTTDALLPMWSILPVLGTVALSILSHFIWKTAYLNQENGQLARLSGMLKNKQQQAEILIQSLADGVIVINTEAKINLINPVAAAMTEWAIDEATGLDINIVTKLLTENGATIDEKDNPFAAALLTKKSVNQKLQLVGKNNKETMVSIVASPIMAPGSQVVDGVVAVLRDVSVEHKEERQRADFISTASHEMRTPVAAIEGYLALALNERVSKIDPKARGYLEKAHESTQHLGTLFQDLLTSAKAEDGRLVSHPQVVELGAYLEQLTDGFRFAAQKKGLLAEFIIGTSSGSSDQPSTIGHVVRPLYYAHVDPDRLREVVTNLFDNAVKYTPEGKVSVGLTGNTEVVQLFIRDTGPGIPKEDIPHLFQKFYRVDSSATRTIGGTGLGLFICRKIIELYHGRIWVESDLGKGSTFYINLPRISSLQATELQRTEAQNQTSAPITSLTTPVI